MIFMHVKGVGDGSFLRGIKVYFLFLYAVYSIISKTCRNAFGFTRKGVERNGYLS